MRVDWRPRATRKLVNIHAYISEDSPTAADIVFDTIVTAANAIPKHPYIYHKGRCPTRAKW